MSFLLTDELEIEVFSLFLLDEFFKIGKFIFKYAFPLHIFCFLTVFIYKKILCFSEIFLFGINFKLSHQKFNF